MRRSELSFLRFESFDPHIGPISVVATFAIVATTHLKFRSNWHRECRLVAVRTVNVFLATLCGNRSGNELPKRPSVGPLIAGLIVAVSPTHRDAMQYH